MKNFLKYLGIILLSISLSVCIVLVEEVSNPAPTEPPAVEQPPADDTPIVNPPVDDTPVVDPPIEQPPAETPPTEQPPVDEPTIDWSTLTYCAFGDSITYGYDYSNALGTQRCAKPYPTLVGEELNLLSVHNYGVSGSTLSIPPSPRQCIADIVTGVSTKYDIISVMGGVNDYMLNLPLGILGDTTTNTVFGGLDVIAKYLTTNFSSSFIFFMTPYQYGTYGAPNSQDYSLLDVANAVKQVASKYNLLVLDMFEEGGFENEFGTDRTDGLHPGQQFFIDYTAPQIVQFIKDNYTDNPQYTHPEPPVDDTNNQDGKKQTLCLFSNSFTNEGATEALRVYLPTEVGYINYNFVHSVVPSRNCDIWRIGQAYAVDDNFENQYAITSGGAEWDMAIKLSGRSDFIGGYAHGDEVYTSMTFFVDGKQCSLSSFDKATGFTELVIEVESLGYDPNDSTTQALKHYKQFVITKDGVTLNQKIEFLNDYSISQSYLAMMPPLKTLTSQYYTNLDSTKHDIKFGQIDGSFTTVTACGDNFSYSMSVPKYPQIANETVFLFTDNSGGSYNKMYFIFAKSLNVKAGDIYETTTVYNITNSVNTSTPDQPPEETPPTEQPPVDEPTIDWSTLTYCSFGDSITAGNGTGSYATFCVESLGFNYYINKARGGGTIVVDERYHHITDAVLNSTSKYDIVSIAGGINDTCLLSPLGEYGDKTTDTIYGCLYLMCEHAQIYWKDSFVFFITPLNCHTYNCDKVNSLGYTPCDVAKAMQEVCTDFDIPVLDMHNLIDYDYNDETVCYDGWHPTQDFHKNVLAPFVTDFIKDNYNKTATEFDLTQTTSIGNISGGQDGDDFGGYLFKFGNRGGCEVYSTEDFSLVSSFALDKADIIAPHSNSVCFGSIYYEETDEFPLLYTNVYNNDASKKGTCCVYRIIRDGTTFTSTLVQVIQVGFVNDSSLWVSGVRPYGNFIIDTDNEKLYVFAMDDTIPKTKWYKFSLPTLSQGTYNETYGCNIVTLSWQEVESQFSTRYMNYMQGATYCDGKIYSTEGFGGSSAPPVLSVIDLITEKEVDCVNMAVTHSWDSEPEMVFVANKTLYFVGIDGKVFIFNSK